jgi:hypothetical protein
VPRAVSRLSLILILVGISALGGVALAPWGQPLRIAPQLLRTDPTAAGWLIFSAAVFYCGSTLVCAFALRRMRPWAPAAYTWFIVSVVGYMLLFNFIVRVPTPLLLALAFYGLLAAALYWGWRVVRNAFQGGENRAL